MANYCCTVRSSYFYVTDEEKYKDLMKHIITCEDSLECWDKEKDGRIAHAFGCYDQILGYIDDPEAWEDYENDVDPDYDYFLQKLSEIIAPGSACVIFQAGSEKLRCVDGFVDVVMPNKIVCSNLEDMARNIMKDNGIDADRVELYY